MSAEPFSWLAGSRLLQHYTRDLSPQDLQRLFTRETAEAYRFFSRNVDTSRLEGLSWHRRFGAQLRIVFLSFSSRLTPARRLVYAGALFATVIGLLQLWRGFDLVGVPIVGPMVQVGVPMPVWVGGTFWLVSGFLLMNLLVLLEVADRLSLKNDLDVAREIQLAMLPQGTYRSDGLEAFGLTRPANTVGGDFYDILPLPDGRIGIAVGDVAGKGSPAALMMALVIAMLRTLVDEGLPLPVLLQRLNQQIAKQTPGSRFITLFLGVYDPRTGLLRYVNAGHMPPLIRRATGRYERLDCTGMALGLFENATYAPSAASLEPGDLVVLYSDGITEAENPRAEPFEEAGLQRAVERVSDCPAPELAGSVFEAVARHCGDAPVFDDLTLLVLRRPTGVRAPAAELRLEVGAAV